MQVTFEQRLGENYTDLSARLKQAAEFVAANPIDTATRSLRAISSESGLSPASFSRLARELGYADFEELRETLRHKIGRQVNSFADRAGRLQSNHGTPEQPFLEAHGAACLQNIETMLADLDRARLEAAVDHLHRARKVLMFGALGSTGIVEYMAYMAQFLSPDWHLMSRMGASLGSGLSEVGHRDTVVIVTKPPFSNRALQVAEVAKAQGAYLIVITDTVTCPALVHADNRMIVSADSPHFFSSYVATLFLVETLVGMVAGRSGAQATRRIAQIEALNRRLEVTGVG